ncbi:MAG: four helix bundle protein [Gemmatimonadaceae bacterium]
MHPYRRLSVWQKAHVLAVETHRCAERISYRRFPGLANQLTRAAMSIPANVAVGCGRDTAPQFMHFLKVAIAASRAVDYLLLLAADLDAITRAEHARLEARADEVSRMLVGLRASVKRRHQHVERQDGPPPG